MNTLLIIIGLFLIVCLASYLLIKYINYSVQRDHKPKKVIARYELQKDVMDIKKGEIILIHEGYSINANTVVMLTIMENNKKLFKKL